MTCSHPLQANPASGSPKLCSCQIQQHSFGILDEKNQLPVDDRMERYGKERESIWYMAPNTTVTAFMSGPRDSIITYA